MLKVSNLSGFGAGVVGIPVLNKLLLESGDVLLLEDGTGGIGLESGQGTIDVTRVALNTVAGTQDITIPGFGNAKAAIFVLSQAISDGVVRDNLSLSYGVTDGTNQWVVATRARHGVTTSATSRRAATDEVIMLLSSTTGLPAVEANFDSWITDGVRINIGLQDPAVAYLLTVTLLGGANIQAVAGTTALATQNNTVTISPGFETNALLVGSQVTPGFTDASSANTFLSFGLASYDGASILQNAFSYRSDSALSTTLTRGEARTGGVFSLQPSDRHAILQNITSTSFDLKSINADMSSWALGYLAIGLSNGARAWSGMLDTPISAGNNSWTGVGFRPTFGMTIPNMITTIDTEKTNGEASAFGIHHFSDLGEYMIAWADESGVGTTNTQVLSDDSLNLDDHDGTAAFDGSFVSFDSDGITFNFSVADGTIRKWPVLLIRA